VICEYYRLKPSFECSSFLEDTPSSDDSYTTEDLYSDLSAPEHDDPSNAYINQPKQFFQNKYDKILHIEVALPEPLKECSDLERMDVSALV
jgi:hypothetical protein